MFCELKLEMVVGILIVGILLIAFRAILEVDEEERCSSPER